MLLSLGLLFAAFSSARCIPLQQASKPSKLLLVSFDGFRWNYDQDVDTPNLDAMAADGVKAKYMTPAYVTLTSPCHFTLLTGRYLENHGVIHNMWFNTSTGVKLPYYTTQGINSWWDNGSLPIWITAQRQASVAPPHMQRPLTDPSHLSSCRKSYGHAMIPGGCKLPAFMRTSG
ncbi:hypothetical protein WISP_25440 [Willisornis vidua]|uniref:Ectonucleotide pyrophosphatase/phosphodiesterase 7 n=1 Tax=Willisornis vidua TaxID=1566151 RepID=A0ABQ9DM53_9PASS|nr:hypothetical protein WISP_25440 [Willisornis vidua]